MACQKSLDFASASGAHLSFYWDMNEAGAADKVDSTVGLHWPLKFGAAAIAGLFSNGTHMSHPVIINQNPGLGLFGTASITINQAVSKGISVWFWINLIAYGNGSFEFDLDTHDPLHTNRLLFSGGFTNGATGVIEIDHTNDTDDVFVDTPNLMWSLGSWHMVAATYDKVAQTLNTYVDGALAATIPDAFVYPDLTTTDLSLENVGFGGLSDDVVDELGLCLNGALTQSQITSLWNSGAGVTWPGVTGIVPFP